MKEMKSLDSILSELYKKNKIAEPLSDDDWEKQKAEWYNADKGKLNEVDGYNCDICKNKGDIARVNEYGYTVHYPCKCMKIRATLRRAKRSGLGDILKDCTFDKFQTPEAWQQDIKQKTQAFCKDDKAKWFYIGGQVGAGKSHLCTAICGYYIKAGQEVRYMLWAEDSKKLKAVVNDSGYQEMIHEYKEAEVLYIDDFLKVKKGETPTTADINLAFEIINHRLLNNEKITIISSEKTLDEIMDYDEATMSRIYQKTGNYKISIGTDRKKNYRLKEQIIY